MTAAIITTAILCAFSLGYAVGSYQAMRRHREMLDYADEFRS